MDTVLIKGKEYQVKNRRGPKDMTDPRVAAIMQKWGVAAEIEVRRPGGKLLAALLYEDGTIGRLMSARM